ncbi:MAG: hypothetical protein J5529_13090 [Prevotella sp.]|nr:hypothetical protein [Prevotella sp.]
MKPFIFFILAVFSLQTEAQCRYCNSYEDYKTDNWKELPSIDIKHYSNSKQLWTNKHEYQLKTDLKSTKKMLSKEALIIQKGDTMYVNLRYLRCEKENFGKGLAYGIPLIGKKILFISKRVDKKSSNNQLFSYLLFGVMGSLISSSLNIKNNACYILDTGRNGKYTDVLIIDDEVMKKLLVNDKELLDKYFMIADQNERETPSNILPLLKEKGLIEQ